LGCKSRKIYVPAIQSDLTLPVLEGKKLICIGSIGDLVKSVIGDQKSLSGS
jgi:hypothetical protein